MNLEEIKSNKVGKLLAYSIPCIIGMLLTATITLVDSYFIGNYVGKEGTAAVSLGLPILYLYLGIGLMIGVGGISLAGRLLGGRKLAEANNVFRESMLLTLLVSGVLSIIMLLTLSSFGGGLVNDAETLEQFIRYYSIMIFAYPFMIINSNFGMFLRGEGKPQVGMLLSILSLVLNLIMDYLSQAVFALGIRGIALASLISILISFVISIVYFVKGTKVFHFGKVAFSKKEIFEILVNGSSEMIGELSMCITMAAYNAVVLKIGGVSALAAFAVVGYASYIFGMIMTGIGQGLSPLASFAYGAKDVTTTKNLTRIATIFAEVCGVIVCGLLVTFRGFYGSLFVKDTKVSALIISGIVIFAISFLVSGFNVIASFCFTSIGAAKESAVISSARGLVVLLIALFVLSKLFGLTGVWLVAPVTEALTAGISCFYYKTSRKLYA